jgi:(1->4)-alpha-D-glucan 1-alpha-D-glucosylmutase
MMNSYRLQLNGNFNLKSLKEILPYLDRLGITHLYLSPIFRARKGSPHGYDVADPTQVSPEIGGQEGFEKFLDYLAEKTHFNVILDIVPNHMVASADNPWWRDILLNGPDSAYREYFDIEWYAQWIENPPKVLIPALGKELDEVLAAGDLKITAENGVRHLRYFEHLLPLNSVLADVSQNVTKELLDAQYYQLIYWRRGMNLVNYRRFFDINELAGVKVEISKVFEQTHELILKLAYHPVVTGIRIDHIDGLLDPYSYLQQLSKRLETRRKLGPFTIHVEKILAQAERLPEGWPVDGTTGYDFLGDVNKLFVHNGGYHEILRNYHRVFGEADELTMQFRAKMQVIHDLFQANFLRLRQDLAYVLEGRQELSKLHSLIDTLKGITASFKVYRTYTNSFEITDKDRTEIEYAINTYQIHDPNAGNDALTFWRQFLLLELYPDEAFKERQISFLQRWQQVCGAVMAKGYEDTFIYRYHPLCSFEVGCDLEDVDKLHGPVEEFHLRNAESLKTMPYAMTTTSTHDTKRSEDVRTRINVLSEMATLWGQKLEEWRKINQAPEIIRSSAIENLIYQIMIGVWPTEGARNLSKTSDVERIRNRVVNYVIKAIKEAKEHTSWIDPQPEFEKTVTDFVRQVLDEKNGKFWQSFRDVLSPAAYYGAINSLSQLLLKIGSPGSPDFYQGTELWDDSLVDPDNRRPVDFHLRAEILNKLDRSVEKKGKLQTFTGHFDLWQTGAIKLYVMQQALKCRKADPLIFLAGKYLPLRVTTEYLAFVTSFARQYEDRNYVVVAPRLLLTLQGKPTYQYSPSVWGDGELFVPPEPFRWTNVLTGESHEINERGSLLLREICSTAPFALLANHLT